MVSFYYLLFELFSYIKKENEKYFKSYIKQFTIILFVVRYMCVCIYIKKKNNYNHLSEITLRKK